MNWYIEALKKYGVFHGRAGRKEYWYFLLVNIIINLILTAIDRKTGNFNAQTNAGLFSSIYGLAVLIPAIAVTVRRFHDTGRSGWYWFLWLIPCIGWIIALVFAAQDSAPGDNEYGPNPHGPTTIGDNISTEPTPKV